MKNLFVITKIIFLTLLVIVFTFPIVSEAAAPCSSSSFNGTYCTLAPIGDFVPAQIDINAAGLTTYLNNLFRFGIALAGALAVLMIVIGGLQYLSTDAISGKSDGRARITQALQGLLLALLSYLILNTINPQILSTNLTIEPVKAPSITDASTATPLSAIPGSTLPPGTVSSTSEEIAELTRSGQAFPKPEWNAYALEQVKASNLPNLTPTDAERYFPEGVVTAEGWVKLLASIAKKESAYDPSRTYFETDPKLRYNSVGLLQLSQPDKEARELGYTEEDLKDPYKNLQVGIKILERQIANDGVISGKNSKGEWIGGTEYWSTLR